MVVGPLGMIGVDAVGRAGKEYEQGVGCVITPQLYMVEGVATEIAVNTDHVFSGSAQVSKVTSECNSHAAQIR